MTRMPAVRLDCGYLSHPVDRQLLLDARVRSDGRPRGAGRRPAAVPARRGRPADRHLPAVAPLPATGSRRTAAPLRAPPPRLADHVDVTKLGNIQRSGWRYVGTASKATQPSSHRRPHRRTRQRHPRPAASGTAFVHTVIDDTPASPTPRSAPTRQAVPPSACSQRAVAWFAERGVTVERVRPTTASAYRSHAWRDACAGLDITPSGPGPTGPRPRQDRTVPPHPGRRLGHRCPPATGPYTSRGCPP